MVAGLVSGARKPTSRLPLPSWAISSSVGGATLTTTSAAQTSLAESTILAPALTYSSSGMIARVPAPASTRTSIPRPVELAHDLGHERHPALALAVSVGTPTITGGSLKVVSVDGRAVRPVGLLGRVP